MENEENRCIIYKKASEDKVVSFCQFSFVALSTTSTMLLNS